MTAPTSQAARRRLTMTLVTAMALVVLLACGAVYLYETQAGSASWSHRLAICGGVLLVMGLAARGLSRRLQSFFSPATGELSRTIRRVIESRDLSLRAGAAASGELDELCASLNEMLDLMESQVREHTLARNALREKAAQADRRLEEEVAEHERTVELLRERVLEVELRDRDFADLAYIASHDLQEPLRKIEAFGDQLRSLTGTSLDERGHDYLIRMQAAAKRMRTLIFGLLELFRVSTRGIPFRKVDLSDLLEDLVGQMEERTKEVGGQISLSELPCVEGDPLQLRQLFGNLVHNGLKFSREGVPPRISIGGEIVVGEGAPYARIRVEDNGIGILPEHSDQIFGVFQRLHGHDEYGGTGIGLAICRRIAERHNGGIVVESNGNSGSTFTVKLPQRQRLQQEHENRGERACNVARA